MDEGFLLSKKNFFEANEGCFYETADDDGAEVDEGQQTTAQNGKTGSRKLEELLHGLEIQDDEDIVEDIGSVVDPREREPQIAGQKVVDKSALVEETHEDHNCDEKRPNKAEKSVVCCRPAHTHQVAIDRRVAAENCGGCQSESDHPQRPHAETSRMSWNPLDKGLHRFQLVHCNPQQQPHTVSLEAGPGVVVQSVYPSTCKIKPFGLICVF